MPFVGCVMGHERSIGRAMTGGSTAPPWIEVRCPAAACRQLLARRHGAVVVVLGATVKHDRDGRVRLQCPSCGTRVPIVIV